MLRGTSIALIATTLIATILCGSAAYASPPGVMIAIRVPVSDPMKACHRYQELGFKANDGECESPQLAWMGTPMGISNVNLMLVASDKFQEAGEPAPKRLPVSIMSDEVYKSLSATSPFGGGACHVRRPNHTTCPIAYDDYGNTLTICPRNPVVMRQDAPKLDECPSSLKIPEFR